MTRTYSEFRFEDPNASFEFSFGFIRLSHPQFEILKLSQLSFLPFTTNYVTPAN